MEEVRKLINNGKIIPTVLQVKAAQQAQEWKFGILGSFHLSLFDY
jgi:hypothetical protein